MLNNYYIEFETYPNKKKILINLPDIGCIQKEGEDIMQILIQGQTYTVYGKFDEIEKEISQLNQTVKENFK